MKGWEAGSRVTRWVSEAASVAGARQAAEKVRGGTSASRLFKATHPENCEPQQGERGRIAGTRIEAAPSDARRFFLSTTRLPSQRSNPVFDRLVSIGSVQRPRARP